MTTIDAYQESADSTTTYLDYCEVHYPLLEDPAPLPFYDTPLPPSHLSAYHRTIEIKRRVLEYRAKY